MLEAGSGGLSVGQADIREANSRCAVERRHILCLGGAPHGSNDYLAGRSTSLANRLIYSTESIDISADGDKKQVRIELSSSGYRERYVTLFVEEAEELDRIIAALQEARASLT